MYDLKVDGVIIRNGNLKCLWHSECGFGELDIYPDKDNKCIDSAYKEETSKFKVATEDMGKDFYDKLLSEMIIYLKDNSIIIE